MVVLHFLILSALLGQPAEAEHPGKDLSSLVALFFETADPARRKTLTGEVEKTAGPIENVADAVRHAQFWGPWPGRDEFEVETPYGPARVFREGSESREADTAGRPLVLCFGGRNDLRDPRRVTDRLVLTFGPDFYNHADRAVVALPGPSGLHETQSSSGVLRRVLREVRRRIHVDTDRVVACGFDEGGALAWHAALFNPDWFAGIVSVASTPRVPHARQLLPLLLPNLGERRVLTIWPIVAEPQADEVGFFLATKNELLVDWGRHLGLSIRGMAAPFKLDAEFPPLPEFKTIDLESRMMDRAVRPPPGRLIDFWFRFPEQGDTGWLRATKTYDDVWIEDQLSILPAPNTDRDAFITDVLKEKLFHLTGRVDGQTLHIETRRLSEIEVRLFDGMVDFSKPIVVTVNGRKRHDAVIRPSVATLLESARADWETQRLVFATLTFTIAPDKP